MKSNHYRILLNATVAFTLSLSAFQGCTHVSEENTDSGQETETVYFHFIPGNLEECFEFFDRHGENTIVEQIRKGDIDYTDEDYTKLRTEYADFWYLWSDSKFAKYFNNLGIYDSDQMMIIVFTSYARRLNGEPIKLQEQIEEMKGP